MKITTFLIFIFVLNVSASLYSQTKRFTFDSSDRTIKEILSTIETQSDFRFFYNDKFLDLNKVVSLAVEDMPIEIVLDRLVADADIAYKLLDNNLIVFTPKESLQQGRITGRVTDASTGESLIGVYVIIEGTNKGVVTDMNGHYELEVSDKSSVILFKFLGYNTERVTLTGQSVYDLKMVPDIQNLDEIIVIGYGTREKKDITTSISSIESKDIGSSLVVTPQMALQGKSAGIFVESGGGNPNSRPIIRIRGTNTWGITEPLYVIDGIPLYEYGSGAEGNVGAGADENSAAVVADIRGNMNVLSMINPADIESISVLKDASASAIYGARASNGVVLITTKKGASGKPRIDVNLKRGIQNIPRKYAVLGTSEYTALYTEAFENNPDEIPNFPQEFDPLSSNYLGDSPTYDWITPLYNKNAEVSEYNIRLSGGSEFSNYYVSTGYARTESPLIRNNMNRYSLATNVILKINKYISAGVNYRFVFQRSQDATPGDMIGAAVAPPWQPIYSLDGTGINGYEPAVRMPESTMIWGQATVQNIYGYASTRDNHYNNYRNLGNAFVEIEPLKGLKIKGVFSADYLNQVRDVWQLYKGEVFNTSPTDYSGAGDGNSFGQVWRRDSRNANLMKEITLSYARVFGNHSLDVLFSGTEQTFDYYFCQLGSEQLSSEDPNQRNIEYGARGYSDGESMKSKSALQGYLGRLTYNFRSKYYIDVVVRRDGSSKFAPGKKWGTFPALSAAWRVSDEPFMKELSFISDLKLRAGWGQIGNQETKSFAYLSLLSRAPHTFFGNKASNPGLGYFYWGVVAGEFPNPDLRWEKTVTTNVGLDGLLFNRLNFTIEYYDKTTDGLIQSSPLPASVGSQENPIINVGKIKNKGIELSLGIRGKVGELNYTANTNLTTVKNEVMKTFLDTPVGGEWGDRVEMGLPIFSLWGYKLGGIFQNEQEVIEYQAKVEDKIASSQHPGDMWFVDTNNDGVIDDTDRTFLGKTIPGFYYGFNFRLDYKGIDLACYFTGVGDVEKINYARTYLENMSTRGSNQLTSVRDRWTESNHSSKMPRAAAADPASNCRFSDRWIENAAYFRLTNAQIGYSIPKLNAKTFENIRVWGGVSNLFTLTGWSGLDPENETIPIPRVFTIGIDATF